MSIKIKPVLCGKKKCKKLHFIFAYERSRGSDGKVHEKYIGKVAGFGATTSGGKRISQIYDTISILPPHTGKYKQRGKIKAVDFLVPRSLRTRILIRRWQREGDELEEE